MNRQLFASSALTPAMMTPTERAKGRFMRAPDGHGDDTGNQGGGGGNDSTPNGDNNSGNDDPTKNGTQNGDNTSTDGTAASFWKEQASDGSDDDDSADAGKEVGQQIMGLIQGFKPSAPVFSADVAAKIAEGDFEGVNEAIMKVQQESLTQSVAIAAKLVTAFGERMSAQMEKRISEALAGSKNNETLEQAFPAAKDPAVRPMIQQVFDQSLKNTKGDREAAIKMTRDMLNIFGDKTGLRTPPQDPGSTNMSDASKSLVDELLSRQ